MEEFLENFSGLSEYGCVVNIFKIPELCVGGEEVWDESELGFIVCLGVTKDSGENYDEEVWGEGASLSYPSFLRKGGRRAICFFDGEGEICEWQYWCWWITHS